MIGPKIKALALTVEILWPYIYFLVMADISHYGNHNEMVTTLINEPDHYEQQVIANIFPPPLKYLIHIAH